MSMYIRVALFLMVFMTTLVSAQKPDSLHAVLDTAKNQVRVKALNELFRAHLPSEPLKAMDYAREALSYATEIGDRKGLAAAYNNLGVAYRMQGALDKSLEYYINALKIYEEIANTEGMASTKNNISTIYSMKKDFSQSMKYLEESYKEFVELKDTVHIIGSLNNLGNLHSEMQLFDKAAEYYAQASSLSTSQGASFGDPLNNLGNLYFRQKNYQRAVEFYEKALQVERQANNKGGMVNVLTNLGITYTRAKQPKPAQVYLDEAFALCNQIQAFSYLPALYKAQAENYSIMGKFKEAYETQLQYDKAREQIYGEESSRNIAQMELRLSSHEREKEYEILKKDDAIKTLELHRTRLVIIMVIMAGLVVLGSLNYIYLSKKKVIRKKEKVVG